MKTIIQFAKRLSFTILLVGALFFVKKSTGQAVITVSSSGSFTVPVGVTSIKVEAWGGGGAGGGSQFALFQNRFGGGGGGGGYSFANIPVNSGQVYSITIGSGGAANSGAAGGNGGTTTVTGIGGIVSAPGGSGGGPSTAAVGGAGGIGNGFTGGTGGTGTSNGAGGGGAAGNAADGAAGTNITSGTGGIGSPNVAPFKGGNGGNSQNNATNNGNTGIVPGGGGGGGKSNTSTSSGGVGADGQVVITYTCPAATISYTGTPFCKSVTSATPSISGSTGGTFSATPAGLTINASTGAVNPSTSTTGAYTVHYQIAGGNGCTAVDATAAVTIRPTPVSAVPAQSNISCNGANDGSITVSASGGTSPYTFSINNGASFESATGTDLRVYTGLLPNTTYIIKVKDFNGCISK